MREKSLSQQEKAKVSSPVSTAVFLHRSSANASEQDKPCLPHPGSPRAAPNSQHPGAQHPDLCSLSRSLISFSKTLFLEQQHHLKSQPGT